MDTSLELRRVEAAVELADTLAADFDVTDLLYGLTVSCTSLLAVDSAGLLLADEHGRLRTVASSHPRVELLELFQLQVDEGPCVDCFHTGKAVSSAHLDEDVHRWPTFVPRAQAEGVSSVHAVPMKLRSEVIGGLNLFRDQPGPVPESELAVAQAFATAATIGILHTRAQRSRDRLTEQLQNALDSRVLIEQAKGYLAHLHQENLADAFTRLRTHARHHGIRLTSVARDVISGNLDLY